MAIRLQTIGGTYRGLGIYDVKVSVCFVLKFALPPFSPPLPSVMQFSEQNKHCNFDIINLAPCTRDKLQPAPDTYGEGERAGGNDSFFLPFLPSFLHAHAHWVNCSLQ